MTLFCYYNLYIILLFIILLLISNTSSIDDNDFPEAGWNDPDIVLVNGKWRHIIEDPNNPKPPPPYDEKWRYNDTEIIILIASFRETRCKDTLFNFFSKSAHPNRVKIGVVQQNEDNDPDCHDEYCKIWKQLLDNKKENELEFNDEIMTEINNIKSGGKLSNGCPFSSNIKMMRLHASEAKGPVYARALQVELVDDEEFCMQIDAHTDVIQNWDVLMLNEWGKIENEYAIISTYPSNIKDIGRNSNNHYEMPHLCSAKIVGNGAIRNDRALAAAGLTKPIVAPLWAAGLSFGRCHAEKNVPNDINLKHVFNGEEFSRGARLWTHGYDFYTITRAYIGTWYQSEKGGLGNWRTNYTELQASNARMATLLKFPGSDQSPEAIEKLGRYNLGKRRSYSQYIEFSGVDTINKKVNMEDKCIRFWVPWDDSELRHRYELKKDKKLKELQKHISELEHKNNILEKELIEKEKIKDERSHQFNPNSLALPGLPFNIYGKNNSNIFIIIIFLLFICLCIIIGYLNEKKIKNWFTKTKIIKNKTKKTYLD